jgi:MerR family transcriptional regulator, mercuric resistance operon regulatory protein
VRSGEVARHAGVNIETLRYYERRGLIDEPERLDSGYRSYGSDAVKIVRFIKRAQELGFSLSEIEVLLDLAQGGPDACDEARGLTTKKAGELERKIADLQLMRRSLQRLAATCDQPRDRRDCPLIQSIVESAGRTHP